MILNYYNGMNQSKISMDYQYKISMDVVSYNNFKLGTLYVALEFITFGDLRTYLRTTRRRDASGGMHKLPPTRLLNFALDVAKGMDHLSKLGVRMIFPKTFETHRC